MVLYGRDGLLNPWVQSIASPNYFGSCFYDWNKEINRFESKNSKSIRSYTSRFLFATIYGILMSFQILTTLKHSSKALITHNILFLTAYIQSLICCYVDLKNKNGVISLANSLIEYEEDEMETNPSTPMGKVKAGKLGDKNAFTLEKYLIQMQTASGISLPILYHMDVFRNPCNPMYFGYWLSNQCHATEFGNANGDKWAAGEIITVIGIICVSYRNWSFTFTGYCYDVTLELIIYGRCFSSFIQDYGRNMMLEACRSVGRLTQNFRKIQLMLIYYRYLYSKLMLSTYMVCLTTVEILCLYNTISAVQEGTFMSSTMNFLYAWGSFLIFFNLIFCFGALAGVYQTSRKVHEELERKVELRKSKWFKRWLRSCPILRIYFGGTNYLVELTPLNVMDFVIDVTVSLLLLK